MESLTELGTALFAAAALISLFAVLRLATRSASSPAWLTSTLMAYAFAVPFTIAVAASFGFLGYALQPFMNVVLAGFAAVAIHLALLAAFRVLLPVKDGTPAVKREREAVQTPEALAA